VWDTLYYSYLPAYKDGKDSVLKGRHIKFRCWRITQKESIQHSEHGKSLKSRTIHLVDNVYDSDFIKIPQYELTLISVHAQCSYYMNMDRKIRMGCKYCYKMYHTYSHLNIPDAKFCDQIIKVLICGSVHCSTFV